MKPKFSSFKLVAASLTGAAFLVGCDKKESAAVAPAPETAPVPAMTAPAEAVPDAPAETAPALTGEAAIEAFKTEVKGIKAYMEANQGTSDATASLNNLRELIRRAAAVDTAGLPEDLASAYTTMTAVMQSVQSTLDDLPVPVDQLQKFTDEETAKGGPAAEEIKAKRAAFAAAMAIHQTAGEAATANLKDVGAKYGIEALDLGGN